MPVIRNLRRRTVISSVMNKDAFWNLVSMLVRPKTGAANNATNNTFVDSSPSAFTLTKAGNPTQGSFSPYGSTGGSMYFDGNGDYFLTPADAAFTITGDYTMEAWVYGQSNTTFQGIISSRTSSGAQGAGITINTSGYIEFMHTSAGNSNTALLPMSQWTHVAMVRQGTGTNNCSAYVNGVRIAQFTSTTSTTSNKIIVGRYYIDGTNQYFLTGYVSDARFVNGTALYSGASFVLPTAPLTAVTNTKLLMSGTNDSIRDYSSNGDYETVGNTKVSTAVKKFTEGSMYFDGSGDYLLGQTVTLGLEDFTFEGWFNSSDATAAVFSQTGSNTLTIGWNMDNATQGIGIWKTGVGVLYASSFQPPSTRWFHLAVTSLKGVIRIFVDGVQVGANYTNTFSFVSGAIRLGTDGVTATTYDYIGYMDDVRLTKGYARYITDFAVDTQTATDPYAAQSITLTTNGVNNGANSTILDSSANNFTITRAGNVTQGSMTPYATAECMQYSWHASSVSTSDTTLITASATNLTVEAWVKLTTLPTQGWYASNGQWPNNTAVGKIGSILFLLGTAGPYITDGTTDYSLGTGTTALQKNAWYHIAYVKAGSTWKAYVNGVLSGSIAGPAISAAASIFGAVNTNGTGCGIGGSVHSFRVVDGYALYSSNFTPAPLTVVPGTTALIVSENGTIVDKGPKRLTLTNTNVTGSNSVLPSIAPTTATLAGGSLYFDGTGDYLNVPDNAGFNLGTGDFTLEGWIYPTATVSKMLIQQANAASAWQLWLNGSSKLALNQNSTTLIIASNASIMSYTWTHIAVTRAGTAFKIFINGVLDASATSSASLAYTASQMFIGTTDGSAYPYSGYMSDLRIVKGTALYTAAFTPPTAPLTAVANTQLLLSGTNSAIYDSAGKVAIETVSGAKVSTGTKKYVSSLAFNGTTDYLKISDAQTCVFGTGDFTVECWINFSAKSAGIQFFNTGDGLALTTFVLGLNASQNFEFYTGAATRIDSGISPVLGTWYHVACARLSGVTRLYINGTQAGSSYTDTNSYTVTAGFPYVGVRANLGSYFSGYIEDLRITKGVGRYVTGFTPPTQSRGSVVKSISSTLSTYRPTSYNNSSTTADPYYNNVSVHMHMEGANGSTNFADQKGNVVTVNGSVKLTTTDYKFGATSANFVATSSLQVPATASISGTGDFTVEFWINPANFASSYQILFANDTTNGLSIGLNSTGTVFFGRSLFSITATTSTSVTFNAWNHIAIVRNNGTTKIYINGASGASIADTYSYVSGIIRIGADGGGTVYPYIGKMDELRVTKGIARYVTNFTPSTTAFPDYQNFASDAFVSNTTLIKKSSTSTALTNATIVDSSSNNFTVTRNGDVTQGTFSPFSNAGFSNYFSANNYVTITPAAPFYSLVDTNATFTVEAWVNLAALPAAEFTIAYCMEFPARYGGWRVSVNSTGTVALSGYTSGNNPQNFTSTSSLTVGKWHHVAVVGNAGAVKIYINGVDAGGAGTISSTWQEVLGTPSAAINYNTWNNYGTGYISNLRITNTAVYTSNFTVPTSPLTAISGTLLLTCQDNRFKDNSSAARTIALTGTPSVQAFAPFAPTTYSAATHGGSMYFDGTGDYLATTNNSVFDIGNNPFTIEGWFYIPQAVATNPAVILTYGSSWYGWNTTTGYQYTIFINASNQLGANLFNGSTGATSLVGTSVPVGQWNHFALAGTGTNTTLYLNGSSVATAASYPYTTSSPSVFTIGSSATASSPSGEYFTGYMSNIRVIKGTNLYTGAFTPPTAPLTAIANTQLLLSGTNSGLVDVTGKSNISLVGNAKVSTANKKFNSSLFLDGSTNTYAILNATSAVTNFGTADFTVEMWVYRTATSAGNMMLYSGFPSGVSTGTLRFIIGINASNQVFMYTNGTYRITSTVTVPVGVWTHIALSRVSGSSRLFVNGVQSGSSYADTNAYQSDANRPFIGGDGGSPGTSLFVGYVEDVRITPGVGRYITNFTPPLASFPATA